MKLLAKFSLIFIAVFGLGLGLAGFVSYSMLQANARKTVQDSAQIMMETASDMRRYTSEHVKTRIAAVQTQGKQFDPETVPAFSAMTLFGYLRENYPDYSYKEAALNPTNPRDRAEDWEADIINAFRNDDKMQSFGGVRKTPTGDSQYLARPIRATADCLQCHSTPDAAPPSMIAKYGDANGFGWRENDVVAAQIVSVPVALPMQMADQEFRQLMVSLAGVGAVTLLVLDMLLYLAVIRPVGRLAEQADQISKGKMNIPELPAKGKDEISVLAAAFNRMQRSLIAAMKLLDK